MVFIFITFKVEIALSILDLKDYRDSYGLVFCYG